MNRLNPQIQKVLTALNFVSLTPVQSAALGPALDGKDLIVQSYTGTGKTLAFLLPIISQLSPALGVQALVLTPTRELAVQVGNDARKFSKPMHFNTVIAYGGASIAPQIKQLQHGAQLAVGTPGRILDLITRGELNLSSLKFLVLDEADVMLDMGFQRDVEKIISFTPKHRQTMLFCVDLPREIESLANKHMRQPHRINLLEEEKTTRTVTQWLYQVPRRKKLLFTIHLLREIQPKRSIIFCKTKFSTKKLAFQLQKAGFHACELHGNLTQARRDAIMADFKAGKIDLLIATDVAARGIHVNQVSHVFNYELPADVKYYLHRIGRTGRMNAVGDAISLVSPDEEPALRDIEILIGKSIERRETPAKFKGDGVPEQHHAGYRPHGFHKFHHTRKLFS